MATIVTTPTYDGEMENLFKGTWTGARDSSASDTVNTNQASNEVRSETGFHCSRFAMTFNLSSIPSGSRILSATLTINVTGTTASDAAHGTLHLVESTQPDSTELTVDEFNNFGTTNFSSTVDASTTGSKTFTFVAAGITYLESKTGSSATLMIRTKKDFDNTAPTGSGNMNVDGGSNGTPANRPTLTITTEDQMASYAFFM